MKTRNSTFSEGGGGGKFNGVEGVIQSYTFTTRSPFVKVPNDKWVYGVLTTLMDGATEPEQDAHLLGASGDFHITDDGRTIKPLNGRIWGKSQTAIFISSLSKFMECENGELADDLVNFDPIVGRRVRFGQVEQLDKNKRVKMRKYVNKDGKEVEVPDTTTIVTADYGYVVPRTAQDASGGTNGETSILEVRNDADEALEGLVEKFGAKFPKERLRSAQAQLYLKQNYPVLAEELLKILGNDDYLAGAASRGVIEAFAKGTKDQSITAKDKVPY